MTSQNAPFNFILFFFLPDEKLLETFIFSQALVQCSKYKTFLQLPGVHVPRHLSAPPETQAAVLQMVSSPDSPAHCRVIAVLSGNPRDFEVTQPSTDCLALLSSPLPLLHWFQGTVRALVTLETRFHIGCFLLSVILGCHHSKWYFSIANKSISSTLPLKSGTGSQGLQLPMLLYLLLCQWRLQKPKEQHQVKDYPDAWQYKKLDRQRRRLH